MLRCHEKFKTPWSLINHLLLCPETSKGDVDCQDCTPSHVVKRVISPAQLWRRLSGGRKRPNGASLDWPLPKRGRVDECDNNDSFESLPVYEDVAKYGQYREQQSLTDVHELDALQADLADLEALHSSMPRHTLQQGWSNPVRELAEGSVKVPTASNAVELDTSHYCSGFSFSGELTSRIPTRQHSEHFQSPVLQNPTAYGTSAAEASLQEQPYVDSLPYGTSTQRQQDDLGPIFRQDMRHLDPKLRCMSEYSLAPEPADGASFEIVDDGDGHWFTGPDYSQQATSSQVRSTSTMRHSGVYVTNPGAIRLSVVTQPRSAHAYGQEDKPWPLTNSQLLTPMSNTSGPSATSSRGAQWPCNTTSSSASTSTTFESPTVSSTLGQEARRTASGAGRSDRSILLSPLTEGPMNSEDNISPSTDRNPNDVCPHCDYVPKGDKNKNYRTHMKRHIKTHEPGQHDLQCEVDGCGCTIKAGRKDNLRQHMKKVHSKPDSQATAPQHLYVPDSTPSSAASAASFRFGEHHRESWVVQDRAGHFEANVLRKDSNILVGISSDRGSQLDSLQIPGGLAPTEEEDHDDLIESGERRSDVGHVSWKDLDFPQWI